MLNYDWDFTYLIKYTEAFLNGTQITFYVSIVSFLWGTIIGIFWGIFLKYGFIRQFWLFTNDIIRSIPMLVLLFFFYYLPLQELFGFESALSSINTAIIALGLAQVAYTGDIVRSAINNVSKKIIDGAKALGLSTVDRWRFIIIPDILKQIVPAQIAFFIGLVRLSSLASIIGVQDVVHVARTASTQNFRSIESWIIVAIIYVIIVLPFTYSLRYLENSKWLKRRW